MDTDKSLQLGKDDKDELEDKCTICLGKLNLPVKLKCGHSFCFLCLKSTKPGAVAGKTNCALCRKQIDIDINKLSLADIAVQDDVICLDDQVMNTYPKTVWLYSSNDVTSWWYYDNETNKLIEELYGKFTNKTADDFKIHIGAREYELDFETMLQVLGSDETKKRAIKRLEMTDEKQEELLRQQYKVRGIAGVRF
jgi:hypothetical protein